MRTRTGRNQKGAGIILISIVLGMLLIPMIGIFTFEFVRAHAMHAQLQHATQAAALAATARQAASDETSTLTTHQHAKDAALWIFRQNAINQYPMLNATEATSASDNPGAYESSLFFEFLDNDNNVVNIGNAEARSIHVVGAFGLMPVFSRFFAMSLGGPYPIRAESFASVPDNDIVLGFDVSGSIDDMTSVGLICRWWQNNRVNFRYAQAGGRIGNGTLRVLVNAPAAGTAINCVTSQNLASANGFQFAGQGSANSSARLRNRFNIYGPPGNHPSVNDYSVTPSLATYTHLVVNSNTNGNNEGIYPMTFGPITVNNIAEHVALSAGYLDSQANFNSSLMGPPNALASVPPCNLSPMGGASITYRNSLRPFIQPLGMAQDAAQEFFTILNNNTDSHFGLTLISNEAPSNPANTKTVWRIGSNYSVAGQENVPEPGVPLSPTQSNFQQIFDLIPQTIAEGSTGIHLAIDRGRQWLNNNSRPGVDGQIVIFTDGQPNGGIHTIPAAHASADACRNDNITVHSIGLAQNPEVIPGMVQCLNDGVGKVTTVDGTPYPHTVDGCAARGAGEGRFFLVSDGNNLRWVFQNLARSLVKIVKVR